MYLWHGSKKQIEDFNSGSKTGRRELHLGTIEQASMRNPQYLYLFEVDPGRVRRVRDNGEVGGRVCNRARSDGFDCVTYLNRYEGITNERLSILAENGMIDRLDNMTDAKFRKYVPEAEDSYAILDPARAQLIAEFEGIDAVRRYLSEKESCEDMGMEI